MVRRFLVIAFVLFESVAVVAQDGEAPLKIRPDDLQDGLETGEPVDHGIDEKLMDAMRDSILGGVYTNIHSVLVLRNNVLVFEKYFSGKDQIRGTGFLDVVDHSHNSLHDIRSVTKSVVATAVFIALDQKKLESLNQNIFDFLPEYGHYRSGLKSDITIEHLNMTAGLDWDEESFDMTNDERRMNNSADAIEFVLSREMVDKPGEKCNYNGGCTQLLAEIVSKATGKPVDLFVDEFLFKPLGIDDYAWVKLKDGSPSAASGLRMRSRDMAKLGSMWINNGMWKGKQIVSAGLVSGVFEPKVETPYSENDIRIGYSSQF